MRIQTTFQFDHLLPESELRRLYIEEFPLTRVAESSNLKVTLKNVNLDNFKRLKPPEKPEDIRRRLSGARHILYQTNK